MGKNVGIFLTGLVGIGMASAVLMPGRQTIGVTNAVTKFGTGMLGTAISGKAA